MNDKLVIADLTSNIKNNLNLENTVIISKEISKKILMEMLNEHNIKDVKLYYKDEYVFKVNNTNKKKFLKNDFIFLRSALEETNSIFNEYNLLNEIENINNILNIFFLENNICIESNNYNIDVILEKINNNLLSLESIIFLEILKIWIDKSSKNNSTYINKYIHFLNQPCKNSTTGCLHIIDYHNFYDIEKYFFKKHCNTNFIYNCHSNVNNDNQLKINNIDNYKSYDFENEEDELNFIANDIENIYKKNDKHSIALINNDRYFSRRLRALLDRKNIKINDSSGWLLSTSACCSYINTILNYFINNNNYINLHDILISPFYNPGINKDIKSEFLSIVQKSIKNDIDNQIDINIFNIKNKNPEINKLQNKFKKLLKNDTYCNVEFFRNYILEKLKEFNSRDIISNDTAGKEFLNIIDIISDLYKSENKEYKIHEWQEILQNFLENQTFKESNESKIYLLDIKNTCMYKFDKIYVSSMSSKNYPKKQINNFSKNTIIKSELTLNSNIENQETIKDFLMLNKNSRSITLSHHKSDLTEIYTKSKFKIFIDHFLDKKMKFIGKYSNKKLKKYDNILELQLNKKFKTLTYRDIENFNNCFYCFYTNINSPKFTKSIISKNNFIFGNFIHEILYSIVKNKVNFHDYNEIKENLIKYTNLKISNFYSNNYIPYEIILWKNLIPKVADYFYHDNNKKYNFYSEKNLEYIYKNSITLKGRCDLKYSMDNNHFIVDYKTGYINSRSDVLSGISLQLPFYSILDNNANFFEYLSLNVSKNNIKSILFTKNELKEVKKLIFNSLDSIDYLISNKKKLSVCKSSLGCDICGFKDINR